MIHLEWYRIFLHTAQQGNFTKAAQALHITQPSVSYAIRQMEEELGVKLFHRLSKGVELTEEGRSLLAYVEPSFALLESGEQHLTSLKQLSEGELRVGASDSLIKHLLLPYLNAYHQLHPNVRIRLSNGKTPVLAERLKEGQLDCALVHVPLQDDQLEIRPIAKLQDCFVVGEAYRAYADEDLSAAELLTIPLLMLSPGSSTRIFVEQWFAAKGCTVKPDMELGSMDLLIEFARLGYGAAFVTRSFIEEDLRQERLFELRLQDTPAPRDIGLAYRKGDRLSIAAERFVQIVLSKNMN